MSTIEGIEDVVMKAVVRHIYGSPDVLQVADINMPSVADDEVLVRIRAAGVNMADMDYLLGRPKVARLGTGLRNPKHTRLGLDVAGHVEAVGNNATTFQPGDEVFGDLTEYGFGAFAEYVCAPEAAFALKPANLTFEEAATVPQSAVMALQGVRSRRPIQPGEKVLINGAGGGVGPFAVQMAKSFGAEVTGVDLPAKLDLIRSVGADHVIDYTRDDFTRSGQRYDRILDIAGGHTIFEFRRALEPKGIYTAIPGSITQLFQTMIVGPLISLFGSRQMGMLMWKPFKQEDVAFVRELIEADKVSPIIDRRFPLQDVADALRYQEEGRNQGKLVLTV
jgi:NADPH:quinone reductase-like Zn-dependent oxidoreductase